jgi:hypothetical protein
VISKVVFGTDVIIYIKILAVVVVRIIAAATAVVIVNTSITVS